MHFNVQTHCTAALLAALALTACNTTRSESEVFEVQDMSHQGHGDMAMQLPPGWTMEDMQACMAAGTPGPMHQKMLKGVGTWKGKNTMWMGPGAPSMDSECMCKITSEMDGRYTKLEFTGEMPGMGPFHGVGYNGFDNVSQRFVSSWIDNHNTGIMTGDGDLSADGKTLTWQYRMNCPITKKPATMREVDHYTSDDTMTLEMFGTDPKSGKEYKMMEISLTRVRS